MDDYKVILSDEYIINPGANMDLQEELPLDLSMPKTITGENERKNEDMKEVQSKAKEIDKKSTEKETQAFTNTFTSATVSENKCDTDWLFPDWKPSRDPESNGSSVKSNSPQSPYQADDEESPESGSSGDISGGDSNSGKESNRGSRLCSSDENAIRNESEKNGFEVESIMKQCLNVTVCLHDEKLWRKFASCDTEMIINRGGRRMFPHIVISLSGLESACMYSISMEIVPADNRRYKYVNNIWTAMGMADPGPDIKTIVHPDGPNTGSFWQDNRANFSKVRLTNSKESSRKDNGDGCVLLLSMHKYKAIIKIHNETDPYEIDRIFDFPESTFIAVTAYQNSQITKLKIQNNPFAKAFRDVPNKTTRMDTTPDDNATLNNARFNTIHKRTTNKVLRHKVSRLKHMHEMKSDSDFSESCYPGQSMNHWFMSLPSSIRMYQTSLNQLQRNNVDPNTYHPYQYLPSWLASAKLNQQPSIRDNDEHMFYPFPSELSSAMYPLRLIINSQLRSRGSVMGSSLPTSTNSSGSD